MPFHNIFSKLTGRKTKKPKKVKPPIIADIHEKDSLILAELTERENNKEIELIIQPLKIGDYLVNDIIIERKTISDLVSSIISRRIIEQLKQMKQYKQQILILEGNLEDIDFNQNALKGFILSTLTNYQIPIIFTKNSQETADYLTVLAKQQLKPKTEISMHSRVPKTIDEQKRYVLESFPNIGPATSKKLLNKFKNLNSVFNASEQELSEVLRKNAKQFRGLLED